MSLMEQLTKVVASQIAGQAAQKTGMSEGLAASMMPMAMAALMNGLKKNASSAEGAQSLANALERHDGGLLENAAQFGSESTMADGAKILGHILGGKQSQTEMALAKTAGVEQSQMSQLMAMAAPAVLASLGKAKREQGLNANALAGLLKQEGANAQQAAPNEMGPLMQFLDQDGDGDFKDDLMEAAGKKILGGFFGRK